MNEDIIFGLAFLGVSIVNCYLWRKNKDKDYFWFSSIWFFAFAVNMFDYSTNSILHAPMVIRNFSSTLLMASLPIAVLLSLIILLKGKKKGDK